MKIFVDIDNTICETENGDYINSKPIFSAIYKINRLYENGHHITYWTARGGDSGIDWTELTTQQLQEWKCLYHELRLDKPPFDIMFDDKATPISDVKLGVISGISGIYKIESIKHPNKFYIGSAKHITERWRNHIYKLKKNKHHSFLLQEHYNVYGKEDLKFSIVEECDKDVLFEKETKYLKELNPFFNIYKTAGSPKNYKLSEEHKRKIGKSRKGKKHSEETKKKMSLARKGKKHSKETIEKLKTARKNYNHSEETRKKLSITSKGNNNALGHKVSAESKKIMGKKAKENIKKRKRNDKGQFI